MAMRKLFLPCVLIASLTGPTLPMSGAGRSQTVLVIYSNDRSLPANLQIDEGLRRDLAADTSLDLNYQTEFLDYPRYGDEIDEGYDHLVSDFLRAKYADQSIGVVITVGPQSFRFLHRHQNDLFADKPILAIAISRTSYENESLPAHFLCIPIELDPKPTLELAVRLQPKAREIVVVTGASKFDLDWEQRIKTIASDWYVHPPIRYLSRLPLDKILSELAHLPRNSIVFTPGIQKDGSGQAYGNRDAVQRMAEASSAPLYGSYSTLINSGIVGGYMFDMGDVGQQAGPVIQRILNGEWLTQRDMPDALPSHYVVDWNQLERWHLSETNLPPGTKVVNRPPDPWQKYKNYIWGGALLLTLEALLILYLLAERRRRRLTQKQLAERLRVEILVAQVSSEFANLENGQINQAILRSLQSLQEYSRSSFVCIWQTQSAGGKYLCTHFWPEDRDGNKPTLSPGDFPNMVARLSRGETVLFSGETESGELEDYESFQKTRIRSLLAVPIQSENNFLGALSLVNVTEATSWRGDIVPQLSTIADILGGALSRQYAAEALRESQVLKGVILDYMQSNVVVIDHDGVILEVNQHWIDFASKNGASSPFSVGVGANYLEVCRRDLGSEEALQALLGIQSVLNGLRPTFESEYACPSPSEQRWFRMTVIRLPGSGRGALIIHFNITQQKLAELERERMQEETAQLHRATEMGQLVASLAHELAQPLAAVLSNAQAASHLASSADPDLAEINAALADIIEDDQRARSVLNNVRALLKKHAIAPHKVDLNKIVEDVTLIVRSSAQLRGVQIRSVLSERPVFVQGDEVPLQQVLLNLVNNAMDAMSQVPAEQRVLTLKTSIQFQNESGLLVVEDQGPGVPDTLRAKLFQPFFTTKGEGLGMGLAICQTILQTLGGSIHLQDNNEPGATFRVILPPAA
jgi:signal transduction histidine kinase/transcriptional regulator with XRE-family HTH domain